MEDMDGLFAVLLLLPDHDDPGGLRSGVDLDPDGLGVATDPVLEPDGERGETLDHGPLPFEKEPRPFFRARHQRFFVFVQYEYGHGVSPFALTGLVT